MADSFEQTGIAPELVATVERLGWARPTGLQQDALPIIRRGNNAVLHASAGAGVTGAYGLGVLDRLAAAEASDDGHRALIVVPGAGSASRVAECLAAFAADTGLTVRALAPGWPHRPADVLVASADAAVASIRDSSLKVDALVALVIHGAEQLVATDQWHALETVLEATPPGAQRILVTARLDPAIDSFVERHVRKSMSIPPRPTATGEPPPDLGVTVGYLLCAESDKTAAAVDLIGSTGAGEVAVICRTATRAARLATDLEARGLAPDDGADAPDGEEQPRVLVLAHAEADRRSTRADVLSYDVPFDAAGLADLHSRGGTVLVTPGQLVHLQHIATRAGAALKAISPSARPSLGAAERVRERLREAVQRADLAADLALIEPLLDEFSAPELAAAALHLARAAGVGSTGEDAAAGAAAGRARPAVGARAATTAPTAPPPSDSWVRLFIGAGTRDGLGPGDLVGAIAGETALEGSQVGKIEVRESHSTVEVPAEFAAAVIEALNGRSLRGRSLRVDYDRKERTPRTPPSRGSPRTGGGTRGGSGGTRGGSGGSRGGSGGPRGGSGGPRARPGGPGRSRG
jgi:ATP-dependent RNA helicase DeaD